METSYRSKVWRCVKIYLTITADHATIAFQTIAMHCVIGLRECINNGTMEWTNGFTANHEKHEAPCTCPFIIV